jgi:hypothetical protein
VNTDPISAPKNLVLGKFIALAALGMLFPAIGFAQNDRCDPNQVMTSEACATCHANESQVWKTTPHYRTFDELGRRPAAKEICSKLGLRSVKRSDVCLDCHFTVQAQGDRNKPISGVSCESCHGASKDWLTTHNDFGGPTATKESESPEHQARRIKNSVEFGMQNTRNLYSIASSCLNCHTVPNERLVNVGGHPAGSQDFELVRWSQGQVRHNFLRSGGSENSHSSPERIRVMYIVGLIADLEFSTRATAQATEKSEYGLQVAGRAARIAVQLFNIQQKINDPRLQAVLKSFANAELRTNNSAALLQIADQINAFGVKFSKEADGAKLAELDPFLPDLSEYK